MKFYLIKTTLLCLIISASCHGATRSSLKATYRKSKSKVVSLKRQIQVIEKNLNKNNTNYISTVKKRQQLDLQIFDVERALNTSIDQLSDKSVQLDREYKQLLLNSLDESTTEDLMEKRIVLNRINRDKLEVKNQLTNEIKLKSKLSKLRNHFAEIIKVERDLYDLVQRLESSKQKYVQSYMTETEKSVKLKSQLKRVAKKRPVKKKRNRKKSKRNTYLAQDFVHPITKYVAMDHDQSGITYTVNSVTDIKTSKGGTVVHVGTLANFGNVVMIEHGNKVKSIFLGNFTAHVKKGDKVGSLAIIGETQKSIKQNTMGKLYFEVRQKNKVQNTIKLVKSQQTQV